MKVRPWLVVMLGCEAVIVRWKTLMGEEEGLERVGKEVKVACEKISRGPQRSSVSRVGWAVRRTLRGWDWLVVEDIFWPLLGKLIRLDFGR